MERPTRTREHQIADLSINHVERFILRQGYTAERVQSDYGYDLVMRTFDYGTDVTRTRGAFENGVIYFQFKATDSLNVLEDGRTISIPIWRRHLQLWRTEPMPVILIVYDAQTEQAYWHYVQRHLQVANMTVRPEQQEVALHVFMDDVVNTEAVETWRQYKTAVLQRIAEGGNLHE